MAYAARHEPDTSPELLKTRLLDHCACLDDYDCTTLLYFPMCALRSCRGLGAHMCGCDMSTMLLPVAVRPSTIVDWSPHRKNYHDAEAASNVISARLISLFGERPPPPPSFRWMRPHRPPADFGPTCAAVNVI
jgi:hypothetical protein